MRNSISATRWVLVLALLIPLQVHANETCPQGQASVTVKLPDGEETVCGEYPRLLKWSKVPPKYPKQARKKGIEGQVILKILIDKKGRVLDASVVSEGPKDAGFGAAAIEAVRQWRYKPAQVDGEAVDSYFHVKTDFSLHSRRAY